MSPHDSADEARYDREREYHDRLDGTDPRSAALKYYAVDAGKARYDELVGRAGPGDKVLEYGCGRGSAAFDIAAAGADVVGIDISPKSIEEARAEAARRQLSSAAFQEMNAEALSFSPRSFDLVCGSGVLHHLDLERSFDELSRVLRPDGVGVFIEPLGMNPVINLYRRLTPTMRTPDEHPLVLADFDLARRRFATVEVEYFNLLAIVGAFVHRLPGGRRVVSALQAADRFLFERVRFLRRFAWVAVVRVAGPRPRAA